MDSPCKACSARAIRWFQPDISEPSSTTLAPRTSTTINISTSATSIPSETDWKLDARTSYDQIRLQAPLAYYTGLPDGSTTVDTYSFRGNWWDGEVKLSRTLLEKHRITVGTEITDNLRQDQGEYIPIGNTFSADPTSSLIWALYGQDEFTIIPTLTLSAGLRYDHYSYFGGTTNPRLALIYRVFHPTTLKLLYGTAFRAPLPFELTPDLGSFYDDNLKLVPEQIRSVEGVVEQTFGEHFTLSGSVFHNSIDNLITLETNSADNQQQYQNDDKAVATGAGVELNGHLASGLQGRASYTYINAEQPQTKQILSNSPQHLGKLNLSYPVVQQRLFASLDAQSTSSVPDPGRKHRQRILRFQFHLAGAHPGQAHGLIRQRLQRL